MRKSILASTALAAALWASGAAVAADPASSQTTPKSSPQATSETSSQSMGSQDEAAAPQGQLYGVIGREVIGQNGQAVGEIENVLVDDQGRATHVVLDHGGWGDLGEKTIALGFDKLQVTQDDIRVTLSDDQLAALPEYEDTTARRAGMARPEGEREAAEGMRTTTPPDQSAATPEIRPDRPMDQPMAQPETPVRAGADVPSDGTVAGPSGATLDATPGVMKEPVKPKPAD